MRLQLFKGSYGVLLILSMAGLFLMLRRGAGDGFALLAWLGLVLLASGGLVATSSELLAVIGALIGVATTAYLEFAADLPAGTSPGAGSGQWRVEVALGVYLLLMIALAVIWRARRRPS